MVYSQLVNMQFALVMQNIFIDVTNPPTQLQRQLNVDDVEMQPSPAYVSLDTKSTQH